MKRALLLFLYAFRSCALAATPCPTPHEIKDGETLESLARDYLGKPHYAIAIALATNERTSEGFPYISNLDDLNGISRVCIPTRPEGKELRKSWEAYAKAVNVTRLPRTPDISKTLLSIPADQPVNVVTWMRKDQADRLKPDSHGEVWVTVEPYLREFCRDFVRDRGPDEAALTRRLEQRLGLGPASNKAYFVRIRLAHPDAQTIFRPCVDSAADRASCSLGPPKDHQEWFYRQYYWSYGKSLIGEFPWTALGYTFDWAPGPQKSTFQRTGESEFVIHENAPIEILEALTTAQYCAPHAQ